MTSQPRDIKTKADAVAWRFHDVIAENKLSKDQCVVVTYSPEELKQNDFIHDSLTELGFLATVVDFNLPAPRAQLIKEVRKYASRAKPHK